MRDPGEADRESYSFLLLHREFLRPIKPVRPSQRGLGDFLHLRLEVRSSGIKRRAIAANPPMVCRLQSSEEIPRTGRTEAPDQSGPLGDARRTNTIDNLSP